MIISRSKTALLCLWIVATAPHFAQAQSLGAYDRYVPMGHSYDTSNRPMPTLNSYDDQVNYRADMMETEIYRKEKERANWEYQLNSTHGTHLGAEPGWPAGH